MGVLGLYCVYLQKPQKLNITMKRLALLLLICFGVSCTDYDLPKPDIDESINIEQTFANSYWQRIEKTSYQ